MIQLLKPFYKATLIFSGTSQSSHGSLRLIIQGLMAHLDHYTPQLSVHYEAAQGIKEKLTTYWAYLSQSSTIPALLDPSTKFETFEESNRQSAINSLEVAYSLYQINNETESSEQTNNTLDIFQNLVQSNRNEEIQLANELATYLSLPPEPNVDPLLWWKTNTCRFPTVALMAADYFALQITSVPCERTFSVAKHTIDNTRNRLLKQTTRALLCLKNWFETEIVN